MEARCAIGNWLFWWVRNFYIQIQAIFSLPLGSGLLLVVLLPLLGP